MAWRLRRAIQDISEEQKSTKRVLMHFGVVLSTEVRHIQMQTEPELSWEGPPKAVTHARGLMSAIGRKVLMRANCLH